MRGGRVDRRWEVTGGGKSQMHARGREERDRPQVDGGVVGSVELSTIRSLWWCNGDEDEDEANAVCLRNAKRASPAHGIQDAAYPNDVHCTVA